MSLNHTPPPQSPPKADAPQRPQHAPQKSRGGPARLWGALRYSAAGLRAAFKHEAAFRQELALGLPMVAFALWLHPGRLQTLALVGTVVLVWVAELLNSALEALADALSTEHHPLLGRAKDLGSAAVMLCLLFAAFTWAVVLWPLFAARFLH
jgi:diacylglycerol kinase (ATP)